MTKLNPLRDQVIVKRKAEETMSANNLIHIPSNAQEKSIEGVVVAVGPGRTLENGQVDTPTIKAGDKVILQKHACIDIKLEGEEFVIIREDNILAILESN